MEYKLVPIQSIFPVERCNRELIKVLSRKIKNDYFFTDPILIDKSTHIILNGHHRRGSAIILGLSRVPCVEIDYKGIISIVTKERNVLVNKSLLEDMVANDLVFPFKTVTFNDLPSYIENPPTCKVPLFSLR